MSLLPLSGLRVLVTRPVEQSAAWVAALESAGAIPLLYPTIQIAPPSSWEPLDEALAQLTDYDWIVFTSATAARFTLTRLPQHAPPLGTRRPQVAAVGLETARALEALGATVSLVPTEQHQGGIAQAFATLEPGTRVLFPQAVGGRDELRNALLARGCIVDVVPASQTIPLRNLPPLPPFDIATFASPSALRAFIAAHGVAPLSQAPVAVLGPTTGVAATALGLSVVTARSPDIQSLIDTLASTFTARRQGAV